MTDEEAFGCLIISLLFTVSVILGGFFIFMDCAVHIASFLFSILSTEGG